MRDGILNHQTIGKPHTLEGKIVRLSDKIAYIHHDMDDAVRAGILKETDVPQEIREVIGSSAGERLDCFIHDIVTNSMGKNDILMSETVDAAMKKYDSLCLKGYIRIRKPRARRARRRC